MKNSNAKERIENLQERIKVIKARIRKDEQLKSTLYKEIKSIEAEEISKTLKELNLNSTELHSELELLKIVKSRGLLDDIKKEKTETTNGNVVKSEVNSNEKNQ